MRGQPGPCLTPGNYPAVARYVRRRKPPPFILWSIGIITCLLLSGAVAMLTIGYLNPFGTVGLSILGVGAVVYFGGILFLILSCLWVERKYPGMQPLSFRIYSRKHSRMPPTTFTNPNISGQMPSDPAPSYRMHNELPSQIPGFSDVRGKTNEIPSTPKDKSQDSNPPSHGSTAGYDNKPRIQFTGLDIVQEEEDNGGIGENDNPDVGPTAQTNNNNVTMNGETKTTRVEDIAQPQPHNESSSVTNAVDQNSTAQHKQTEKDNNVSTGPKMERKVKPKTHHIEVPFEDYPSSDSSTSQSNNKDKSRGIQEPKPKGNSQQINSTTENDTLATKGTAKAAYPTKTTAMDKQKETSSAVNNLPPLREDPGHQVTKTAVHSSVNVKSSSPAVRKAKEIESQATQATNKEQKDSASKSSPATARKMLDGLKHNNTNSDPRQGRTQTSSPSNTGENKSTHNNSLRREQQNNPSPKYRTQNPESPAGSPTHAQRMQSLERAQKIRKDNAVTNSPPTNRKADGSSSSQRHHQKRPQRTQEQSITIQTFSPNGGKEELQKKKILQSSPSSQLGDLSSTSSPSSSPRQRQRSPTKSPRVPVNEDHTARTKAFHSSSRNEELSNRPSRRSSPSSQSSDVPSSPSSSPRGTRQKSPDTSTKMQRHKDISVTSVATSPSIRKDELHKKHSQPSSQSSDLSSSSTSSPVSAKQLLQSKKEQVNQKNQPRTNK